MSDVSEIVALSSGICTIENVNVRERLLRLEDQIKKNLPLIECPVRHYFIKGRRHQLYCREIVIPKGAVLTSKIHIQPSLSVISQGDISVLTETGIVRVAAPHWIESGVGIKRAGYAHEDTVWTTYYKTEETDIETLERWAAVDTFDQYIEYREQEKWRLLTQSELR